MEIDGADNCGRNKHGMSIGESCLYLALALSLSFCLHLRSELSIGRTASPATTNSRWVVAIFAASRRKRGIEYACDNRQSEGEGKGTSDSLNTVWKVVRRWGRGILVKWSMGLSSMLEDTLFAYPPLHNGRRYTVKMIIF